MQPIVVLFDEEVSQNGKMLFRPLFEGIAAGAKDPHQRLIVFQPVGIQESPGLFLMRGRDEQLPVSAFRLDPEVSQETDVELSGVCASRVMDEPGPEKRLNERSDAVLSDRS
jgi:hypothetical protein